MNPDDPLDFVLRGGGRGNVAGSGLSFLPPSSGRGMLSSQDGNPAHLESNVESIMKPPLPKSVLWKLEEIFGSIDYLTGN